MEYITANIHRKDLELINNQIDGWIKEISKMLVEGKIDKINNKYCTFQYGRYVLEGWSRGFLFSIQERFERKRITSRFGYCFKLKHYPEYMKSRYEGVYVIIAEYKHVFNLIHEERKYKLEHLGII
jgi:hypothetical protein